MGDKVTLKLDARELHGKKVAKLRREGLTPGVVYGPGMDPIDVQADESLMRKVVKAAGKHTPVYLMIDTKKRIAMIKDIDIDPVKNIIRHVSFHAVNAKETVEAIVPIRLVGEGESAAEKAGLIVLQALDHIEIKALPMDLPEALEVDIRGLKEAGERLLVGDIVLPEGVVFVEHDSGRAEEDEDEEKPKLTDLMIASVWEPAALQAANESQAGEAEDASAESVEAENGSEVESVEGDKKPDDSAKKE